MHADTTFVAQFLSLVALMAATIEYCEVLQRRASRRRLATMRDEAALSGLVGLVRVFVVD